MFSDAVTACLSAGSSLTPDRRLFDGTRQLLEFVPPPASIRLLISVQTSMLGGWLYGRWRAVRNRGVIRVTVVTGAGWRLIYHRYLRSSARDHRPAMGTGVMIMINCWMERCWPFSSTGADAPETVLSSIITRRRAVVHLATNGVRTANHRRPLAMKLLADRSSPFCLSIGRRAEPDQLREVINLLGRVIRTLSMPPVCVRNHTGTGGGDQRLRTTMPAQTSSAHRRHIARSHSSVPAMRR